MSNNQYFVQRKPSGYLGNAPVWWAEGGGYTAYLEKAKRFSSDEAHELLREDPNKWGIFKCPDIEARCHTVFDMQDFKRLGVSTDDDIGTGPYATFRTQLADREEKLAAAADLIAQWVKRDERDSAVFCRAEREGILSKGIYTDSLEWLATRQPTNESRKG